MKLYELAYACRLYQGQDDGPYRKMRSKDDLGDDPDLASPEQQNSLLDFLNKWGCRIPKENFSDLRKHLQDWAEKWIGELPSANKCFLPLGDSEREHIGKAFDALFAPHFGDTAAAKTLHALRYRTLPAWDAKIKKKCCTKGQTYSDFLHHVAEEISDLEKDVKRLNSSLTDIPRLVQRVEPYGISLVKLVDEYYWITITKDHKVPDRDQLEEWLRWQNGSATATAGQ